MAEITITATGMRTLARSQLRKKIEQREEESENIKKRMQASAQSVINVAAQLGLYSTDKFLPLSYYEEQAKHLDAASIHVLWQQVCAELEDKGFWVDTKSIESKTFVYWGG